MRRRDDGAWMTTWLFMYNLMIVGIRKRGSVNYDILDEIVEKYDKNQEPDRNPDEERSSPGG